MIQHTIIAVALQLICAWFTSDWWLGAAIGAAFYIGREHAQAEYRIIYTHYGHKRANAPWWCGFDRRAWTVKGLMDWIAPAAAVCALAYAQPFIVGFTAHG